MRIGDSWIRGMEENKKSGGGDVSGERQRDTVAEIEDK